MNNFMGMSASKNKDAKPVGARAKNKNHPRLRVFIFFIFAAAGLGMTYPLLIKPVQQIFEARNWVEVPCKIVHAEVKRQNSDDGTTYSVNIRYQYGYENQTHQSSRYSFFSGSSSGYKGKARIVESYKNNPSPVCYVNPANPSEAVLNRNLTWQALIGVVPVVFAAVGICGIIYTLKNRGKKAKATVESWLPETKTGTVEQSRLEPLQTAGYVTLKPSVPAWGKFFGITFFAVFWNVLVSLFLFQDFKPGSSNWFSLIFMIPFVLVGLGVIGYCVYLFLALFNPQPIITVNSVSVPLGGAMEVGWSFSGQTNRIKELVLSLEGKESATYTRGTDTRTDHNTFYEVELFRTNLPERIANGQVGLVIPPDTMHSFEAKNNKIIWEIKVKGDIKRWPDVSEEFKITVTPAQS